MAVAPFAPFIQQATLVSSASGAPSAPFILPVYLVDSTGAAVSPFGVEDNLTAHAGGTQAAAFALSATANYHRITTCATAADSVILPAATIGQSHYIRNDGAAACQVFAALTETINGIASATGVSLPASQGVMLFCTTAGKWTTSVGVGPFTATAIVSTGTVTGQTGLLVTSGVGIGITSGVPTFISDASTVRGAWGSAGISFVNGLSYGFSANPVTTANNTNISRIADGVLGVGTGAAGSFAGSLKLNAASFADANGQIMAVQSLTELTTIAAAANTDTTIQMPAGAIVLAVDVRVTVVIPTAATFTVGDSGSATRFSTAAVSTAANSTDKGTAAGAYYNASALSVRITPNLTPGDDSGRVRVTIHFLAVTPATS